MSAVLNLNCIIYFLCAEIFKTNTQHKVGDIDAAWREACSLLWLHSRVRLSVVVLSQK